MIRVHLSRIMLICLCLQKLHEFAEARDAHDSLMKNDEFFRLKNIQHVAKEKASTHEANKKNFFLVTRVSGTSESELKTNQTDFDNVQWTTENNSFSSDFNAKENRENPLESPSQSNVPENPNNKVLNTDRLSFNYNDINYNKGTDVGKISRTAKNASTESVRKQTKSNESINVNNEQQQNVPQEPMEALKVTTYQKQRDLLNYVTDFGLQHMYDLYEIKEKEIYDAGIFLPRGSPGSYLAAFNPQLDEAKRLSRFGYAALKATVKLRDELSDVKLRQELFNATNEVIKDFPEISLLDTSLHDDCPLKNNPRCPPWNHLFRTMDGTCNNLKHPWWGARFQPLKRFLAPKYNDGLETVRQSVRGGPLPSARVISTEIHWDRNVNSKSVTHMFMQWGQFIDHDMTSSSQSRGFNGSIPRCCDVPLHLLHPDCLPIEVLPNDSFFSSFNIRCLEFLRSAPASRVGCSLGPREQVNQVTSYIDGSMIYGNSEREAAKLRLFRNGMLKFSRMPQRLPLLPQDREKGEFCRNSNSDFFCLFSGDARMSEQPGLMAIHIVFLRLHNRIARTLGRLNLDWNDELIYQETRKIVGAILQHITYREFLPIVLGQNVMDVFEIKLLKDGYYNGYSEKISGSAANAFATAAFRFGHSMVQGKFLKWDDIRKEPVNNVSLHDELQDPASLHRFGAVDNLMMGMCIQESQKLDEHFTVELTNHLFQTPRFPAGLDLAAINIQRGRDHGIPSYNTWRNPCGLRKMKNWDDLLNVMPEATRDRFRKLYRDVDDIDLFPAGLSEFPVRGGIVGSTFACIIAQHFRNIRRGDRFWYENGGFDNSFTLSQLKSIRRVTLARILCDNLDLMEEIQPFVFLTVDNIRNPKVSCRSREIPFIDLTPWMEMPRGKGNQKGEFPAEISVAETMSPEAETETVSTEENEIPNIMEDLIDYWTD